LHVEHATELCLIRLGIGADFVPGERLARLRASRRIPDHAGEVADDDDDLVAEILEIAQLLEHHGVSKVEVRSGRVEPQLDLEGASRAKRTLELGPQLRLYLDGGGSTADTRHL